MSDANPLEDWVFSYLIHELRTPLHTVLGFSQMMRDGVYGDLNPKQEDRIQRVVTNMETVLRRMDLLLDYQRLQNHVLDLSQGRVTLAALLDETTAELTIDRHGRPFQYILPESGLDAVLAVNARWAAVALREVMHHAAAEAMPDPTIWLSATAAPEQGTLVLVVRYNAPPMDTWQEGNLFTVHNRTGIGLPLALELLTHMHGGIEYDSFTTRHEITMRFPLETNQDAPAG